MADGRAATTVCRLTRTYLDTRKRTCHYCLSTVLLLITGALAQTAPTGLPTIATDSSTLSTPTTTVQTVPSPTGEHAPVNESVGAGKAQQPAKSLESLLLKTSLGSDDNDVNKNELISNRPSQYGPETNQRANTTVGLVVAGSPVPASLAATTSTPTASTKPLVNGAQHNSQPSSQTKSLKFTLIAGKSWKFVIKGNSLSSHNRAELRLHKNVSTSNYIIDDEGWFQYNPQQQQLFAWPSLGTKSGTYYFVLLPSGIDFEADSENIVNLEVAASIVVELIKPVYRGVETGDIDQLIDHEFSLEYLHRHPAYPLLLNQIFSVFETLAKSNATTQITTTYPPSPLTTISPNQQVAGRTPNKLGEYLLLSSSYTQDGELFSLTWSTHSALLNNTITPINECRVSTITDTISKLSTLSTAYQSDDEKFTILYALDAPHGNSRAIVPTERSNTLKVALNRPCQKQKIIEELGIQQQQHQQQPQASKVAGAVLSADDNENHIADKSGTSTAVIKTTDSPTNSPNAPGSDALVTSTANQLTLSEKPLTNSSLKTVVEDSSTISPQVLIGANQPRSIFQESSATDSPSVSSTPISSQSSLGTEPTVIKIPNTPLQQPKLQPQAKSLEDFLEMSDTQLPPSSTPTSGSPELSSSNLSSINNVESTTISGVGVSVVPTRNVTPVSSESTLNEDFMGILDEVMNYLISVAVPASIIVGFVLLISIIFALCHLYRKRRKSKEFQVRNRFDFRYSSERKGFLKNSSRPVILEADQKSLSMGGTPQHKAATSKNKQKITDEERKHYLPMSTLSGPSAAVAAAGTPGNP